MPSDDDSKQYVTIEFAEREYKLAEHTSGVIYLHPTPDTQITVPFRVIGFHRG